MRCAGLVLLALVSTSLAEEAPRSLDPRIKIELVAEQPLLATPTGLDVDARGRVWAIECNTHFRPENYPGHPSDRILVFDKQNDQGQFGPPKVFADGFTATMSVAVRPVWMPPVRLQGVDQGTDGSLAKATQVYVATRSQILLLEDANGDDVADRRTVLFELDTKGNYPHNGFAGFAFDAVGSMFVGMGENLGEPYKVRDRGGAVVYEHDEGGHVYRFQPDGTGFRLWANGCWNPHASCFDAFGRMFSVDNDPDSRPPCRLLHIIEGGDYGYHFKNGRKGLHPFTSWNGELPGMLPMVAGTGEAPSGVIAYEHEAFPAEYRGHLIATSWGDHRIDVFRLKPKGLSFEAVAEPVIVGGENFRPVGLALAPDGSLYCTDWVLRDYKLHGKGRLWRISATHSPANSPDYSAIRTEDRPAVLKTHLESPIATVRRLAARRLFEVNGLQNVGLLRDGQASERARYEALAAVVSGNTADEPRQLRDIYGPKEAPFDSSHTLMAHFGDQPSLQRLQSLLKNLGGTDPMYVLTGMKALVPLMRSAASTTSPRIAELLNQSVDGMDPFAFTALVRNAAADLSGETLQKLVQSTTNLSPRVRLAALLAARRQNPANETMVEAGLEQSSTLVRRAAMQWAGEMRMKSLRPEVEKSLSRTPTDRDMFLSAVAALEMIDGKDPKDFDKTPAGKYVAPLLKDEKAPAGVLVEALRLVDPDDGVVTIELLRRLIASDDQRLRREALRTLAMRTRSDAVDLLLEARKTGLLEEVDLGLARHFAATSENSRLKDLLLQEPLRDGVFLALRPLAATDPRVREHFTSSFRDMMTPKTTSWAVDVPDLQRRWFLTFGSDVPFPATVSQPVDSTIDWREQGKPSLNESADRGWLIFYHPQGPGCSRCHMIDGRGGKVGPDLSKIGATFTREKLIDSILQPSREVSPQFTTWQMVHVDGRVFTGMIVHENEGKTILGDNEGKTIELKTAEIEERRPLPTSVMPEKLVERMTPDEWRNLLTFLQSAK
jgi:putative membrane-bound dehydrogenase-like protein